MLRLRVCQYVFGTPYIKDSFDFKNKIKTIGIPDDDILALFDVVSLYTSISIYLAKNITNNWSMIKKCTDIPIDGLLKAIELTLNFTYFLYEDNNYKQVEGCTMGASISSVIAQFVPKN